MSCQGMNTWGIKTLHPMEALMAVYEHIIYAWFAFFMIDYHRHISVWRDGSGGRDILANLQVFLLCWT